MINGFKNTNQQQHKCQIDCTNHDQVINKLQSNSKDLYYFWRNYEWLYNKYYNQLQRKDNSSQISQYQLKLRQSQETIDQLNQKVRDYQAEFKNLQRKVSNLQRQNKGLTEEFDRVRKEFDRKSVIRPEIEEDYKRELKRLQAQLKEQQEIEDRFTTELAENKRLLSDLQRTAERQKQNNLTQKNIYEAEIRDLNQTLDQSRLQIARQTTLGRQTLRFQQSSQAISLRYEQIQQKAQAILISQIKKAKTQLKMQLKNIIINLTAQQLQQFLIEVDNQ